MGNFLVIQKTTAFFTLLKSVAKKKSPSWQGSLRFQRFYLAKFFGKSKKNVLAMSNDLKEK